MYDFRMQAYVTSNNEYRLAIVLVDIALLYRNGFGQISWLINLTAA